MSEILLKYIPREDQLQMLEFTKSSIESGMKYVLLNAPTGSGKSYYAMMLSNWYKNKFGKDKRVTMLTGSKLLQQQYVDDFPFIKNLKGQTNYWCEHHNTDCGTGKELNSLINRYCTDCPYDIAKAGWLSGDVSLTNFHMFDTFSLYVPDIIESRKTDLLIIDEAHDFESIFTDYISIKLSARMLKNCGMDINSLNRYDSKIIKIKSVEQIVKFLSEDFIPDINEIRDKFVQMISDARDNNKKKVYLSYVAHIDEQTNKFDKFIKYYENEPGNWVLDINQNIKNKFLSGVELILQPIWSSEYLSDIIWDNYEHVVMMSATIIDKEMFSYLNGLDVERTSYIDIDSSFPVENRPIFYINSIGKMTYDKKEETFERQIKIINKILEKYKSDKGIIHTVNYELTDWVKTKVNSDRLVFHDTESREEKYQGFLESEDPLVMVSPSMMTGIDLIEDLGRFGIILKIPYPNISSNKVKARQKSNPDWYNWITCCNLIQTFGRIVRSNTDYGFNFILDGSFSNILKNHTKYLPNHIMETIKIMK